MCICFMRNDRQANQIKEIAANNVMLTAFTFIRVNVTTSEFDFQLLDVTAFEADSSFVVNTVLQQKYCVNATMTSHTSASLSS